MKRPGTLVNSINLRLTDELKDTLDRFASEFGITLAESTRLACYLLADQYEIEKDFMNYYDGMLRKIDEMLVRDAQQVSGDQQAETRIMFGRLKKAVVDGLIARDYASMPQTTGVRGEAEFVFSLIKELDSGKIDTDMFRRRIRHHCFNRLINKHGGGDDIAPEELEKLIDNQVSEILG